MMKLKQPKQPKQPKLPKLDKEFTIEELLKREDGFCLTIKDSENLKLDINKVSNEIHRKSLRRGASFLIVNNINIFNKDDLIESSKIKLRSSSVPDPFVPLIKNMEFSGFNFNKYYPVFLVAGDFLNKKIVLASHSEGYDFVFHRTEEGEIPEIDIIIAKDERFFIGNVSHYGIVEVK